MRTYHKQKYHLNHSFRTFYDFNVRFLDAIWRSLWFQLLMHVDIFPKLALHSWKTVHFSNVHFLNHTVLSNEMSQTQRSGKIRTILPWSSRPLLQDLHGLVLLEVGHPLLGQRRRVPLDVVHLVGLHGLAGPGFEVPTASIVELLFPSLLKSPASVV